MNKVCSNMAIWIFALMLIVPDRFFLPKTHPRARTRQSEAANRFDCACTASVAPSPGQFTQ